MSDHVLLIFTCGILVGRILADVAQWFKDRDRQRLATEFARGFNACMELRGGTVASGSAPT